MAGPETGTPHESTGVLTRATVTGPGDNPASFGPRETGCAGCRRRRPYPRRCDATSTSSAPEYPDHIDGAVLKIAGVVVLGAIMSILDITVVNVALPTFQTEFPASTTRSPYSTVAWTVTGYTLALATVIPMTGWAADRFGTKRLYLAAIGLFTLGSALCATASIDRAC